MTTPSDEKKKPFTDTFMFKTGLFFSGAILSKYIVLLLLVSAQFIVDKYITPPNDQPILLYSDAKANANPDKLIKTIDNKLYILNMDSTEWFKVIAGALTLYETYRKIRSPTTKKETDDNAIG
jgi:hypothetical protein